MLAGEGDARLHALAGRISTLAIILLIAGGSTNVRYNPQVPEENDRLSRMVALLDDGAVVFGTSVSNRGPDGAVQAVQNQEIDFLWYDMEHSAFDVNQLRVFMQFTLDPRQILSRGHPGTEHPILVRVPLNGREVHMNQWMIKNLLDQGIHGIVVPFVDTPEQAAAVVRAMRYPRPEGSAFREPLGERGAGPGNAMRFWGVERDEYIDRSDLWGLSPRGEMLNILLIESDEGVRNIREIAQVPGVSIIMPAPGDLGMAYGGDEERIEEAIQVILEACLEFDVPCGIGAGPDDVVRRIQEGFRVLMASGEGLRVGRATAGRETSPQ